MQNIKTKIIWEFSLFSIVLGLGGCAWIEKNQTWNPPTHWFFTDKTTQLDEMVRTPDKSSKGRVTALWVDVVDPYTVFAGTDGGLFRSTNGGREWFPVNHGLSGHEILSMAQDVDQPNVYYLGVRKFENGTGGIFRSEDSGAHWEFIDDGPIAYSIHSLWVDSKGVYAGSYGGGLFYSSDGQGDWIQIHDGLDRIAIYSFKRNPHEENIFFAGTERGIFLFNEDSNQWTPLPMGIADGPVTAMGVDPLVPGKIYVATERNGFFISNDFGKQWKNVEILGKGKINSLVVSRQQDLNTKFPQVYFGKDSSIYWTEDGGISWKAFQTGIPPVFTGVKDQGVSVVLSLAISPGPNPILYSGWSQGRGVLGVPITTEKKEGVSLNHGLVNSSVMDLLVSKHSPSLLIAATWGSGLLTSYDGGITWNPSNQGFQGMVAHSIEEHPLNSEILYAGGDRGIFKSMDRGVNWNRVQSSIRKPIDIAVDPNDPEIVYASSWGDGIFKSTDGGETWTPKNKGLEVLRGYSIAIDERVPGTLYFGTDYDLYKSTDGGDHWVPLGVRPVQTVVLDPENPSIVYAGTCKWIYKSTNGGKTWRIKRNGMDYTDVYSIAIDPSNTEVIYAGTYEGGMYKTEDAGENWFPISSGLSNTHVYSLALDSRNPKILYAGTFSGTYGSGVYRTLNGGIFWSITHPGKSHFTHQQWVSDSVWASSEIVEGMEITALKFEKIR